MGRLRVYGTVFNNANRVELALASIAPLKPAKIYIADNNSTDGTTQLLMKHKDVVVIREKCNRGKGKRLALERLLQDAEPDDPIIMIDLDTVYKPAYRALVMKKIKTLKDNEMYDDIGQLATAATMKRIPWRDTPNSEDLERFARAISIGIKLYKLDKDPTLENEYFQNETGIKGLREARYAKNPISLGIRLFNETVSVERNEAYRSFKDFYAHFYTFKSPMYMPIFAVSYIIANIMGIYAYDPKLSNVEYIKQHVIKI